MGKVIWTPQPRQAALMARFEDEALYGGAAGGGKSDCALAEALRQVEIPHYRGLILRKTFPQLTELMDRSTEIYRRIGWIRLLWPCTWMWRPSPGWPRP